MTINALLFISRPGIDHVTVSQHGPTFVWDIEKIAMAFLALVVGERGVGFLPLFFVVIFFLKEMNHNVSGAMPGFVVEKLHCVLWGWQMAVHAVSHETLLVVHMG